jgi:NADH-quinone oxidoreductase subunit K
MSLSVPVIVLVSIVGLLMVGLYGLLISRNMIKVVVALQLLVKGAMLALVLAGSMTDQVNLGQSMALAVIVADTIVAVIGLALAVQVRQRTGSLDIKDLTSLRR